MFPVFDCFGGAETNASHTVGAVFAPFWFTAFHLNIIKRADSGTFPARNTTILDVELLGVDKYRIENIIYNAAVQFVYNSKARLWKRLVILYKMYGFMDL